MGKSIIDVVSFKDSKGQNVSNFGILDADKPFNDKGFANGLVFGEKKASLLLYMLETDPEGLKRDLRAYLAISDATDVQPVKLTDAIKDNPPMPHDDTPNVQVENLDAKPEPIRKGRCNDKLYGLMADGSTVVHKRSAGGHMIWAKSPIRIKWDATSNPPVNVQPPAKVEAPTPTDKPILREIVDGDTLVVLYTDGTFKLYETANV